MNDQKKDIREARKEIMHNIVGAVCEICVSAFFAATAISMTNNIGMNKFERGIAIGGAAMVGLMTGNNVTNYVNNGIDILATKFGNGIMTAEDMENQKLGE